MIQRLYIRNYAIISEVVMHFSKNLNIITGETGAGKSIMLGALGLIMGNRADLKILKNNQKKCVVEGYFDILHYELRDFFEEEDLDYDTEVTVRREITPSGKSRAFINDTPVRLEILRRLAARLLDVHQQFDTLDIHNEDFQLQMLDALAGNKKTLTAYQTEFEKYMTNKRKLHRLKEATRKATQEKDFIEFQLEELAVAELRTDEQVELEQELETLSNAENIKRLLSAGFHLLSESEQAILSQLNELSNEISSIAQYHSTLKDLMERYDGLVIELQDIANEFEAIAEDTEYDGERIAATQERLDMMYRLQNKHQVSSNAELLEIQADLQAKVNSYADLSSQISKLERTIERQEKRLRKMGTQLSKKRKQVIPSFEKQLHQRLSLLSMQHARINIQMKELSAPTPSGFDSVTYLFAANKGSRMGLIKDAASGGELSRLTLCAKSLVADAIPLPTLVFDEIDAGVSGDVALKMGDILRDLANRHQVISITHTPQIAARADNHYFVYKKVAANQTFSNVRLLSLQERVTEIATMMSGSPPSNHALSSARELIEK